MTTINILYKGIGPMSKLTPEQEEIKKANRAFDTLLALARRKDALISLEAISIDQSQTLTNKYYKHV